MRGKGRKMIEIRWHGRGGQGAFTASKLLGGAAVLDGLYALSFPSFGPERRGAPIQAFTKIDNNKITDRSVVVKGDYIIYLDETLYSPAAKNDLKAGGLIFVNTKNSDKYREENVITIDADYISKEIIGRAVSNTAMLAAFIAHTHIVESDSAKAVLKNYLPTKIVEKNKKVIDEIIAIERRKNND